MPPRSFQHDALPRSLRLHHRLVRLMDALARGASPPGMIDMTPLLRPCGARQPNAQLRRRFTMIATFDYSNNGTVRHWPAAGIVLSLVLSAVALTGAVRGQEPAPAQPAGAKSAPFTKADAERLWNEKYADRVIVVSGRQANREQVEDAFINEVIGRAGSDELARAVLAKDGDGSGQKAPRPGGGGAAARPWRVVTPADAAKLWNDGYADKLIMVNGKLVNRDKIMDQFVDELERRTGNRAMALRARDSLIFDDKDLKATPKSDREATRVAAAPDEGPVIDGAETPEDRAMAALLARKVPELNFGGVALGDAIDFLRDVSGANLFVEWGALEQAGIDRAAPVDVRVRNVAFGHGLDMVLRSAARGVPIGYSLKGGVIRVSTAEEIDKLTETRAYDVRDVVPAEIEMKELAALVKESVEPGSWRDTGGTVGSLHTSRHKLIVTASEPAHRQIRGILGMLRDEPRQARTDAPDSAAQGPRTGK